MSRIARRGIESTNNRFVRLDVMYRMIRTCWYGITATNVDENEAEYHQDDSKAPPQYTLISRPSTVSEDEGTCIVFIVIF